MSITSFWKKNAFGVAIAALVALWLVWLSIVLSSKAAPDNLAPYIALPSPSEVSLLDLRAKLGDAFGPFNALISAIALAVLLRSLFLQQQQLDNQNFQFGRQLQILKKQIAEQRTQFDAESKLLRQQQFQEQFLSAINSYSAQLASIVIADSAENDASGNRSRSVRSGRDALYLLFNGMFRDQLEKTCPILEDCLSLQGAEKVNDATWYVNELKKEVAKVTSLISSSEFERNEVIAAIGSNWGAIYHLNRFQLDALFRAWYTVYRILDTGKDDYKLSSHQVKLYSATFRAQLSWIELVFLLLNQSALPGNTSYAKACRYSNKYCLFDNLAVDADVVASILKQRAYLTPLTDLDQLSENAFTDLSNLTPLTSNSVSPTSRE